MRACEKTCLEKYGVKNPFAVKEIKDKIKKSCLEKYGVEYSAQAKEIKEKMLLGKKITAYNKIKEKYKGLYEPNFFVNEYQGVGKYYYWKCCKCGNIFKSMYNNGSIISRCFKCYPRKRITRSIYENEICNFLSSYNIKYKCNDKVLILPKELDIIISEKRLAIEFNGNYWHSTAIHTNKNYHLIKTEMCEEIGYKLIHIFEHEWINKQNIIKNKLKSILGIYDEKIYARKCIIKEISIKEKNEFLNKYHIQGQDQSKIKLGLYFKDELVAVMTFGKPRFNKNYDWELIRYATSKHVIGGAGKLLSYFRKHYPGSIITYADRRFSQGNMYQKLGFTLIDKSSPNYWWSNGINTYSRYQCMKHNLKNILKEKFDNSLSEIENMKNAGFYQIYDCGNLVYLLK